MPETRCAAVAGTSTAIVMLWKDSTERPLKGDAVHARKILKRQTRDVNETGSGFVAHLGHTTSPLTGRLGT